MIRFARFVFGRFLPMFRNQNIIWFQSWKAEKRVKLFFCTISVTKKYMQALPKPNWQEIIIRLTHCGSIQELPNLSIGLENGQLISIRAFQTNAGKICRKNDRWWLIASLINRPLWRCSHLPAIAQETPKPTPNAAGQTLPLQRYHQQEARRDIYWSAGLG